MSTHWFHSVARCVSALGAFAALGCDEFTLPAPPDMSGLVLSYEEPSGQLDEANVQAMSMALLAQAENVRAYAPLDLANALVSNAEAIGGSDTTSDAGTEPGEQTVRGNRIDVGAVAQLHHVCSGWNGSDSLAAENGAAELTLTVDRDGLIPTAWGQLERCRVQKGDLALELDGDVRFHFGANQRRVAFRALRRVSYLFSFDGSLVIVRGDERHELDTHFDFRVFPSGLVQLSVALPDATNVVAELQPGILLGARLDPSVRAGLLTRDVNWSCELSNAQPRGSCTSDSDAATELQW